LHASKHASGNRNLDLKTRSYASYIKFDAGPLGSATLARSELYVLRGNRAEKIVSNIQPGGINAIDNDDIPLTAAYLDQRGNLYALTMDATLVVIRDGQIVAKGDVSKIGARYPAMPSMFSDATNTYFLVGTRRHYGPVREGEIKGKYKISLPVQ
jgi:hypothetical protein